METNVETTAEVDILLDELINEHKFDEAVHLLNHDEYRGVFKMLVDEKSPNLDLKSGYRFCVYALDRNDSDIFWQKMAFQIAQLLSTNDNSFKRISLNHLLKAIAMDSTDWKLKEIALGYFEAGLLPEQFSKPYAEIVIRRDPTNRNALRVLESEWEL